MFDEVMQVIELVRGLDEDERSTMMTIVVLQFVARLVYYLVAGVVVLVLGKRMIQAALVAWKETHREGAEERRHEAGRY